MIESIPLYIWVAFSFLIGGILGIHFEKKASKSDIALLEQLLIEKELDLTLKEKHLAQANQQLADIEISMEGK